MLKNQKILHPLYSKSKIIASENIIIASYEALIT